MRTCSVLPPAAVVQPGMHCNLAQVRRSRLILRVREGRRGEGTGSLGFRPFPLVYPFPLWPLPLLMAPMSISATPPLQLVPMLELGACVACVLLNAAVAP